MTPEEEIKQLKNLLQKANRVIEASVRLYRDPDAEMGDYNEYDSAYLAYDYARDVLREWKEPAHAE